MPFFAIDLFFGQPVIEEIIIDVVFPVVVCYNVLFLKRRQASLHGTCRGKVIFLDKISTCRLSVLS